MIYKPDYKLITFLKIKKIAFVMQKITASSDPITGRMLNQSSEVVIDESIGKKLLLILILIWSQKIDSG